MLNAIIRFALQQRLLTVAIAVFLIGYGSWQTLQMDIDVFPDLNRPRVVIMTEAPGLAPEEVETLITFPVETAMNGANGVQAVRSSSGIGISVIYVEFDWGTDIYTDRQIVMERLQLVQDRLPPGIKPTLAPISSIMGQILMLGMWRDSPLPESGDTSRAAKESMELRTLADWVVRQRLLTIPGVSQVFTMGGGRKQFQVLVDPDLMLRYGVTLHQVKQAVVDSNVNTTGGYLDEQGPNELLVRALGRIQSVDDLKKVVVTIRDGRPVALAQIARVEEGAQVKRGDSSAFVRVKERASDDAETGSAASAFSGGPAVVLTINKQPGADTRAITDSILAAVEELKDSLPEDIRIVPVYSQKSFIDRAIENVVEALRDGGLLVVVVLFLFLMNFRTTFITLTAIPLSLVMTAAVFAFFGLSINTMTLGGLAVAIGELVDDAIVDVENIFRRLKENRLRSTPKHTLLVVFQASTEIRNSIVFGTMIVILVFIPLFALSGMEGRLFAPLGVAYIVSILSSLVVSLTVTPVLCYWMLGKNGEPQDEAGTPDEPRKELDSFFLRGLKYVGDKVIRFSLTFPRFNLIVTVLAVALAGLFVVNLERDFLPPFNEGSIQLNVVLPPGTSLATSNSINRTVEQRLLEISDINSFVRRTGRAELDEHAEGVNMSEYILELDPESPRGREAQLEEIREAMADIPGIVTAVEQPIAHLISHMLSGVKAQIGIKIYGDDLDVLRRKAAEMEAVIGEVAGVKDLLVEPQVIIPQLRIELDHDKLLLNGLTANDVNEFVETAMNGQVVSEVLVGQRQFDLLV
ncbi:MAG: CzcA family heavy metal efflux pump, partial [Planctomycetaceae bacterium]